MMKFSKIALAATLMLGMSAAMATKPNDKGDTYTDNSTKAGAVGVGVGLGGSATGGSVGNVAGGNVGNVTSTGGSVGNVAGGSNTNNIGTVGGLNNKSFSPEANANSTNLNTNANTNTQGQQQGQAQSTQVRNAGNNTGTSTVTFNESSGVHYSGEYKVKNVDGIMLGGPASGPCNGFSGGLSLAIPGVSAAANASTVDLGCEQREAARVAAMIGRMDVANAVLEDMDVVKTALKNRDAKKQAAAATASNVASAPTGTQWADSTGKVVYTGSDEMIIRRMGLVAAK